MNIALITDLFSILLIQVFHYLFNRLHKLVFRGEISQMNIHGHLCFLDRLSDLSDYLLGVILPFLSSTLAHVEVGFDNGEQF